ncbi:hypothetical protein MLD38_010619 [Melastoma candidum]|uniref:Uncharacterized protein n=1 Tax=Melastoma candidum TaxID=119954 RepID=A0ACB9R3I1_9MYRT|nr:hypothetical protein MLD38_010619 [Melastoma candidum]
MATDSQVLYPTKIPHPRSSIHDFWRKILTIHGRRMTLEYNSRSSITFGRTHLQNKTNEPILPHHGSSRNPPEEEITSPKKTISSYSSPDASLPSSSQGRSMSKTWKPLSANPDQTGSQIHMDSTTEAHDSPVTANRPEELCLSQLPLNLLASVACFSLSKDREHLIVISCSLMA